jgi:hypothetical protein
MKNRILVHYQVAFLICILFPSLHPYYSSLDMHMPIGRG